MHFLHKAVGTEHIPHPDIAHEHLKVEGALLHVRGHVHLICQVEASVGFHRVAKERHDVLVLAVQRHLGVCLVVFEVFCAHVPPTVVQGCVYSSGLPSGYLTSIAGHPNQYSDPSAVLPPPSVRGSSPRMHGPAARPLSARRWPAVTRTGGASGWGPAR